MARLLDISNDDFIRTTEPRHTASVQAMWQELERRGEIYLGRFAGWYSVRDEAFYDEGELVDGKAPTGAEVEWLEEENYFFRLSAWQDRLLAYYEANPEAIAPRSRRNEVISFVKSGLRDLSISRTSFSWGIPVPGNPKHVIYVWLDALTNYITAVGYPDTDEPGVCSLLARRSPHRRQGYLALPHGLLAGLPDGCRARAAAPRLRPWLVDRRRAEDVEIARTISSRRKQLVDSYGLDPVRYFLLRELPFGSDGDFSHRAMVGRLNGDLANDFGNLAQRVLVDDQPQLRRLRARAGRISGGRQGTARPGARGPCDRARARVGAGLSSRARGDLAGRRRGQPLCRRAGAVGAAAAATRRGCARCSMSWPRRCAIWRFWRSPSCRAPPQSSSTSWRSRRRRGRFAALADAPLPPGSRCRRRRHLPALCRGAGRVTGTDRS